MLMLCLCLCPSWSTGSGSAHHRRSDPGDGGPLGGHWLCHGGWRGTQTPTRCHGSCPHLRTLLSHRCSHHPSGGHLLLCGRQHCKYLSHFLFTFLMFLVSLASFPSISNTFMFCLFLQDLIMLRDGFDILLPKVRLSCWLLNRSSLSELHLWLSSVSQMFSAAISVEVTTFYAFLNHDLINYLFLRKCTKAHVLLSSNTSCWTGWAHVPKIWFNLSRIGCIPGLYSDSTPVADKCLCCTDTFLSSLDFFVCIKCEHILKHYFKSWLIRLEWVNADCNCICYCICYCMDV